MKTQRQHPYYYKLARAEKTLGLLSTMVIIRPDKEFTDKLTSLVNEIETAILCNNLASGFYKSKDLLNNK